MHVRLEIKWKRSFHRRIDRWEFLTPVSCSIFIGNFIDGTKVWKRGAANPPCPSGVNLERRGLKEGWAGGWKRFKPRREGVSCTRRSRMNVAGVVIATRRN